MEFYPIFPESRKSIIQISVVHHVLRVLVEFDSLHLRAVVHEKNVGEPFWRNLPPGIEILRCRIAPERVLEKPRMAQGRGSVT